MNTPKLSAELVYEYEKDKTKGPFIDRIDKTTIYTEELSLETNGWIYHPALMIYTLALSPELEQIRKHESSNTKSLNVFFNGFSADTTIFQFKPYTLNFFGYTNTSTLRSNFAERTKIDSSAYGSTLQLKYSILPTTLHYIHSETEQTGLFTSSFDSDTISLILRRDDSFGSSTVNASYSDNSQKTNDLTIDTVQESLFFHNTIFLNKKSNSSLQSNVSYIDTNNTNLLSRTFRLNEYLSWNMKNNLYSTYQYAHSTLNRHDNRNNIPSSQENNLLAFTLSHTLYENLTTVFSADVNKNQASGSKTDDFGAGINFIYRRNIPRGTININIEQSARVSDVRIVNEFSDTEQSIVITDSTSTILANENIELGTIRVTSLDGLTEYSESLDYDISTINIFTSIRCAVGSSIPNCSGGANVIVSYRYQTQFPFDHVFYNELYGLHLRFFSSLHLYYTLSKREQDHLRGIQTTDLHKETTSTYGADLEWKSSKTNVQYEDFQSRTELSTRKLFLSETIILRPGKTLFLELGSAYNRVEFRDINRTENTQYYHFNIQKLLAGWGRYTMELFMRDISGAGEHRRDSGFSSVLQGVYNIYEWRMDLTFKEEENFESQKTFNNIYFLLKLKRNLF